MSSNSLSKEEKLNLNNILVGAIHFHEKFDHLLNMRHFCDHRKITKIHSGIFLLLFMLSLIVVQIILHISISVPFSALASIG